MHSINTECSFFRLTIYETYKLKCSLSGCKCICYKLKARVCHYRETTFRQNVHFSGNEIKLVICTCKLVTALKQHTNISDMFWIVKCLTFCCRHMCEERECPLHHGKICKYRFTECSFFCGQCMKKMNILTFLFR